MSAGEMPKVYGDGSCAVPGCKSRAAGLMCGLHWSAVPRSLRRDVEWAFDQWCHGKRTLADLRCVQNAAVAAVTGKSAPEPTLLGPEELDP